MVSAKDLIQNTELKVWFLESLLKFVCIFSGPEAAPRYINAYVYWSYSYYVMIYWGALSDNLEVWNIYPQFYRGYLINIAEFSVPSIMPSELNLRVSNDTSHYYKYLQESREYAVRVAAENAKGVGKWSRQICFVMPDGSKLRYRYNVTYVSILILGCLLRKNTVF